MAHAGDGAYNEGVVPAPITLLRSAGLVAATLSAVAPAVRAAHSARIETLAFAVPLSVFIAAFLVALGEGHPRTRRRTALLVEAAAAIAFAALARGGFAGVLVVVAAGQAPFLFGGAGALTIIAAQTLALASVVGARAGASQALTATGGYLGFQ